MTDALISPPVAGAMGLASAVLLAVAVKKVRQSGAEHQTSLMGVLGAFVFAAQMINFSIPGTGSSGHLIGGVLLSALLGPWAALLTLTSVLVIQCLLFADGGLLALGCNVFNMAVCSCLIAYPLIFRPLAGRLSGAGRMALASVAACVVALELGALAVVLETRLSGIAALPLRQFLWFMLPIHLLIGLGEGIATAAVLGFVRRYRPELLVHRPIEARGVRRLLLFFGLAALLLGGVFSWLASENPDGLEWAVGKVTGGDELQAPTGISAYSVAETVQESTALLPDYDHALAGMVGCLLVVASVWIVAVLWRRRHKAETGHEQVGTGTL